MKRSGLSVLIASGLILIAVTSATPSEQSRNQRHAAESDKYEDSANDQPTVSPAFYAAILGELRALVSEEVAKQEQEHTDHEDWSTKPFWITLGLNGLLVLVGLAYTVVAYCQLGTIDRQTKILGTATRAQRLAAIATEESAQAAKSALHINRPFLVPDGFAFSDEGLAQQAKILKGITASQAFRQIDSLTPSRVPVSFTISNYGNGPAVIDSVVASIALLRCLNDLPENDFSQCEPWICSRSVLGGGDKVLIDSPMTVLLGVQDPKAGWIDASSVKAIIDNQAILVVYGQVSYRDYLLDAQFFSDFFWIYGNMPLSMGGKGKAFRGPKERNRYH